MKFETLFNTLWNDYIQISPSAKEIRHLFEKQGEKVLNDHVAFRTFDAPEVNIEQLAKVFRKVGYVEKGSYQFEAKRLFAKHFEHESRGDAPRVFISQLLSKEFSPFVQQTIEKCLAQVPKEAPETDNFVVSGRLWGTPSYAIYQKLREESEYAAWLYVYGFRVNHFTININALKKYQTIEQVNDFLEKNGYELNDSGGKIKGTKEQLLQQSSTLAEIIPVQFQEGEYQIPSCYYEFAIRYPDSNGNRYSGFIAKSADKIFESTDYRQ